MDILKKFRKVITPMIIIFVIISISGCSKDKITEVKNKTNVKAYNNENLLNTENQEAQLHFINTGNSDAILIKQGNQSALIDGGDNDD